MVDLPQVRDERQTSSSSEEELQLKIILEAEKEETSFTNDTAKEASEDNSVYHK